MIPLTKYRLVYFRRQPDSVNFQIIDVLPMDTIESMLDSIDEYTQVSIMEQRQHSAPYYKQIFHISRID